MTYYPTLAEDVARAKEILAKGRALNDATLRDWQNVEQGRANFIEVAGGAIFGADTYAAYKLLESFVEVIETNGLVKNDPT